MVRIGFFSHIIKGDKKKFPELISVAICWLVWRGRHKSIFCGKRKNFFLFFYIFWNISLFINMLCNCNLNCLMIGSIVGIRDLSFEICLYCV